MEKKYLFNMAEDSQKVFRILLDCLSNSGRMADITEYIEKFRENGDWYALAATLLDGEVSFYSNGDENIKREIEFLTGSNWKDYKEADFIFLTEYVKAENMISEVKCGTFVNPHDSATLLIKAEDIPDIEVTLQGVGVPPQGRKLLITKQEKNWIENRKLVTSEYPCGVDLIFLRPNGTIYGISRKAGI